MTTQKTNDNASPATTGQNTSSQVKAMKTFLVWTHQDTRAREVEAEDKAAALAIALALPTPVIGPTLMTELPSGDIWSEPRPAVALAKPYVRTKKKSWRRW